MSFWQVPSIRRSGTANNEEVGTELLPGTPFPAFGFLRNNVSLRYMRLIKRNMDQIVALCEKHKVLELCVFGSAVNGRFNKNSDVDFSVIFDRKALPLKLYGENYFNFKFALEDLLKRDVDLVEYNAVKNPYFKEELDETKQRIYGRQAS